MGREIKFRGILTGSDIWVFGYLLLSDSKTEAWICTRDDNGVFAHLRVKLESIGQFTGFHDKNGKDIYEGERCQHPSSLEVFIVKWSDAFFAFRAVYANGDCSNLAMQIAGKGEAVSIGNIHEPPQEKENAALELRSHAHE